MLREALQRGDKNMLTGIKKFSNRVVKLQQSQLSSALHCFGKKFLHEKSLVLKNKSSCQKKYRGGGINVQPEAIKRRKEGHSKTKKTFMNRKPRKLTLELAEKGNPNPNHT